MSDEIFDSDAAATKVTALWLALGNQIAAAVPTAIIDDSDPVKAVRWATCAEACFWQATGEGTAHDVKDILAPPANTIV